MERKVNPGLQKCYGDYYRFHCDEVTACILLKSLDKWKDSVIIRTRDNDMLEACDILVDIGAKYDPETNRWGSNEKACN